MLVAFLVTMTTVDGQRVCREPDAWQRRATLEGVWMKTQHSGWIRREGAKLSQARLPQILRAS